MYTKSFSFSFHPLFPFTSCLFPFSIFLRLSLPSTYEKSRNGVEETKTRDEDVEMLCSSRMWVSQSVPVNQVKAKLEVEGNLRVLLGVV